MQEFQYYKRGVGELNTSNFPLILEQGYIYVDNLDSKTYVSLLAFQAFLLRQGFKGRFPVTVGGYVEHLRGDKDFFPVTEVYNYLWRLKFTCTNVQHESTNSIQTAQINNSYIAEDLGIGVWFTNFYGADSSVPKFCPTVSACASKVRSEGGKVTSLDFTFPSGLPREGTRIVIVDDILGGGATVQMFVDKLRGLGFTGEIYLWVAYNEGIHREDFLEQFTGYYIGKEV